MKDYGYIFTGLSLALKSVCQAYDNIRDIPYKEWELEKTMAETHNEALSVMSELKKDNIYMQKLLQDMLKVLENGLDIEVNSAYHKILKEKYDNTNNK